MRTLRVFGVHQIVSASANAVANVTNNGAFDVTVQALADASTGDATAGAYASGIFQDVSGSSNGAANVVNRGDFLVNATATALGGTGLTDVAEANAFAIGVDQEVDADGTSAVAVFSNLNSLNGTLVVNPAFEVNANALADGQTAGASAIAVGVDQDVGNGSVPNAAASVVNQGGFDIDAVASAFASSGNAEADAVGTAVVQNVTASVDAFAFASNDGARISVNATAIASATFVGDAAATAHANGIVQYVNATATDGVATAQVLNDGVFYVGAEADAVATSSDAFAFAAAVGVSQSAFGGATAQALLLNDNAGATTSGIIDVSASAVASAGWWTGNATARAQATGAYQGATASSGDALASAVNHGVIDVNVVGSAFAESGNALVQLGALGIDQSVQAADAGRAYILNGGGTMVVSVAGHAEDSQH